MNAKSKLESTKISDDKEKITQQQVNPFQESQEKTNFDVEKSFRSRTSFEEK